MTHVRLAATITRDGRGEYLAFSVVVRLPGGARVIVATWEHNRHDNVRATADVLRAMIGRACAVNRCSFID